ncbi:MAG: hypothetical protein AB2L13_04715 [Spirochaetota bacterium]
MGSQAMLHPGGEAVLAKAVESIGVPVYLTGMARGLLGRNHPLLVRHRRREALAGADLVILAGMPCDFRLNYGRDINTHATLIGVNRSRADLYLNRRPDLAVHADPMLFLTALATAPPAGNASTAAWRAGLTGRDITRDEEIVHMAARRYRRNQPPRAPQTDRRSAGG